MMPVHRSSEQPEFRTHLRNQAQASLTDAPSLRVDYLRLVWRPLPRVVPAEETTATRLVGPPECHFAPSQPTAHRIGLTECCLKAVGTWAGQKGIILLEDRLRDMWRAFIGEDSLYARFDPFRPDPADHQVRGCSGTALARSEGRSFRKRAVVASSSPQWSKASRRNWDQWLVHLARRIARNRARLLRSLARGSI